MSLRKSGWGLHVAVAVEMTVVAIVVAVAVDGSSCSATEGRRELFHEMLSLLEEEVAWLSFGHDIGELVSGGDPFNVDEVVLAPVAESEVSDLHVANVAGGSLAVGDLDGGLVVAENSGWGVRVLDDADLDEEAAEGDEFLDGVEGATVLTLCGGESDGRHQFA
eukprot:TRINITY_DN17356_c0_g1_i1.p1 TRINITY_DN17356_c0_g1~~TRINITY_DN17356_c0_g1_i1.p1  ORF type:complete len:164 (-),score=37.00 TRINITY_DN17356_c0_g1_i1:297-788(-)